MNHSTSKLTGIVAMTPQRVIGRAGGLPWHLPEDMAFFKKTTIRHAIIMGRKTYDSIGRPLPKRRNIVISRDENWRADGVETVQGVAEAMALLEGAQAYVIGGAEIYELFLPFMDELLISHVHAAHEGDTFFPDFGEAFPDVEVIFQGAEFTVRRHRRVVLL